MDKKIILEIPTKETLYFKKEIKEDPNTMDYKLKEYGIKKLYHELPMSRKTAIKADINNGFKVVKENIDGVKKFGEIEKLVYLEKEFLF